MVGDEDNRVRLAETSVCGGLPAGESIVGELVRVAGWQERPAADPTVETLAAEIVAACRERSGLDPETFARAVNDRSRRRPGLLGGAVRAAEQGTHPLALDLVGTAMLVAGVDAAAALSQLLGWVS